MKYISKYRYLALFALVLLQVLMIFIWGSRRENFYWDEYFTFEKTHYASKSTPEEHFITEDKDYKLNEWLPISVIKDTLVVTKDNSIINDPLTVILRRAIGYNNYVVYHNVAEAILYEGKLSKWPGIIVNVVFFILNQLLLFALAHKMSKNDFFAVMVTAFYGFSSICISMATFVRFYMLATLFSTLFTFLHYKYFVTEEKEHLKRLAFMILAFFALMCGYNNAQFQLIYGGFFIITFSVWLLITKGIKRFLFYFVPVFAGGISYLYTQTEYLQILFDFENGYMNTNGAAQWCIEQIIDFRPYMLPGRVVDMAHNFGRYLFGSFFFMVFFMALIMIICIKRMMAHEPILCVSKERVNNDGISFARVLFVTLVVYFIFFTIFGLFEQIRYISYVFPICSLVVAWIAFWMFKSEKLNAYLLIALVLVEVLSVNIKGKVDMLYTGDAEWISKIRAENANSIMIYGAQEPFTAYQSVLFVDDDAEFYAYDGESIDMAAESLRDGMLLMTRLGTDYDTFIEMIREKGFELQDLGWTYSASVQKLIRVD